jgi:GTP cyclohydrolase FolE2
MADKDRGVLPDLNSEVPNVSIPVHSVGHVGVKRIVPIAEHDSAAMVVMDISVGLHANQRGAHMSRLIECIDRPGLQPTVLDYTQSIFERLREAVPAAASWSVDARATIVLPHDGGFKPIDEICRIEAAAQTEVTWGAAFKVCLACPQAQTAIAFDRDDMDNVGEHPSHNQVCDLEITVTGDLTAVAARSLADLLAVGEDAASGPVRELYKRRGEADAVTAIHHHAVFAEDALRIIADKTRAQFPTATKVTCQIVNYESVFEYPLRCVVIV